jgi:hypothetical protein
MRLLFVADGRSPTAINWIRPWIERGDEVYLASTYPCTPIPSLAGLIVLPLAFNSPAGRIPGARGRSWRSGNLGLRTALRAWVGPLMLRQAGRVLDGLLEQLRPDLVHTLRIPFEGMLVSRSHLAVPLIVSVWGNDFTLHASSSPLMAHLTRRTVTRADALLADCQRDIRLAETWGFRPECPKLVVPGNGGVCLDLFFPPATPVGQPVILNPRGFRAYIRNDTFFRAIPLVLAGCRAARFICPGMAGEAGAWDWIRRLGVAESVELLPALPYDEMPALYRSTQVLVSPSVHDGTPNSLLEGMACGCFPVAGDLESIREWITPDRNGLLIDAADPAGLAEAILRGINEPALRSQAAQINAALVAERAGTSRTMLRVEELLKGLLSGC